MKSHHIWTPKSMIYDNSVFPASHISIAYSWLWVEKETMFINFIMMFININGCGGLA